jgi:hypothetical protein
MTNAPRTVAVLSGGDIVISVDPGASVHIRCVTPFGDPVELNAEEVKELCAILERLVPEVE